MSRGTDMRVSNKKEEDPLLKDKTTSCRSVLHPILRLARKRAIQCLSMFGRRHSTKTIELWTNAVVYYVSIGYGSRSLTTMKSHVCYRDVENIASMISSDSTYKPTLETMNFYYKFVRKASKQAKNLPDILVLDALYLLFWNFKYFCQEKFERFLTSSKSLEAISLRLSYYFEVDRMLIGSVLASYKMNTSKDYHNWGIDRENIVREVSIHFKHFGKKRTLFGFDTTPEEVDILVECLTGIGDINWVRYPSSSSSSLEEIEYFFV